MNHKLWVDDLRPAPDESWDVAKTSRDALRLLNYQGQYTTVSLDHDLGGDDTTRPIVLWWCEFGGWPETVLVHSANPVGSMWLTEMVKRYHP